MPDSARPLISRREWIFRAGASLLFAVSPRVFARPGSGNEIVAIRVWPSADYTRVAIEYRRPVKFSYFQLSHPDRLVVDLEDVEYTALLQGIDRKIPPGDPNILALRAGRYKPGIVRLVMEVRIPVKPQVFVLTPVGSYAHRLVLDVYPSQPADPLSQLIQKNQALDNISPPPDDKPAAATTKPPEKDRPRPDNKRLITVMLDPGHGGEDPGAIGRKGSCEKNITLALAKRLQARINAEPNMRAALTRETDYFVPLQTRVQKARDIGADLFVSIHADAFRRPEARGSSVFILSERGASSSAAHYLAQKENEADLVGGVNLSAADPSLARTLLDLSQTATGRDSLKLGKAVLAEIGGVNHLHRGAVEHAGFAVLKAPDIPSILVEAAFISNPQEEKRLNDAHYQNAMARAIVSGIRSYAAKNHAASRRA